MSIEDDRAKEESYRAAAEDIGHRFTNHPPGTDGVMSLLDAVTYEIRVGTFFTEILPPGREKSLAITKLEECSMWAKAAIARNQPEPVPLGPVCVICGFPKAGHSETETHSFKA